MGMYLDKTIIQKDTCTPMFIAALFTIARTSKQPKCPPTDEWIKKMWHICTMDYYSATKKNEIMPFAATWMDLEIIILSNSDRERQIPYDITYTWNLQYDTNELIYKTETDSQTERMVAKGEGGRGRMHWEFGISRCKLSYIEWINNKVLLYSTGNYIQYPVVNHSGKECMFMCN